MSKSTKPKKVEKDFEVACPDQVEFWVGGRLFIQRPLSAFRLIKLFSSITSAISKASIENPFIQDYLVKMSADDITIQSITPIILTMFSSSPQVLEGLIKYGLLNQEGKDLSSSDISFIGEHMKPTELSKFIEILWTQNEDELRMMYKDFTQMLERTKSRMKMEQRDFSK